MGTSGRRMIYFQAFRAQTCSCHARGIFQRYFGDGNSIRADASSGQRNRNDRRPSTSVYRKFIRPADMWLARFDGNRQPSDMVTVDKWKLLDIAPIKFYPRNKYLVRLYRDAPSKKQRSRNWFNPPYSRFSAISPAFISVSAKLSSNLILQSYCRCMILAPTGSQRYIYSFLLRN